MTLKSHTPLSPNADDNILDLDALADEPTPSKGVVLKRSGSVGEIIELSEKDPAQLTDAQRQQISDANKRLTEAFKPVIMSPQFKEAMNVGQRMTQVLESIKIPDIRLPELTDISRYVTGHYSGRIPTIQEEMGS